MRLAPGPNPLKSTLRKELLKTIRSLAAGKRHFPPEIAAELAALLQLSSGHFSRLCKQRFGISPRSYIARKRIEAAREMMRNTDEPLTHIAHAHGFCDQSHFCRTFRREIGINPRLWRLRQTASEV